ncbi:MAG: hypothetical protein K2O65_17595 [Lachnospiraceae bacterium]|nr:hypothetical protein [Lachnospiraceae bacterium]
MTSKNRKLQKLTAVVIVAGMCLGTISGCGSGADSQEDAVTLKEQNGEQPPVQVSTEETAVSGNVAEQVQAPEIYQTQVTGDAVTITADAAVIIPDVPGIKLKKVTARTFTQEDYDAINRVLLGGGKLWERNLEAMQESQGMFREEIDERIAKLEKRIAQEGVNSDATYNSKGIIWNQELEKLKTLREYAVSKEEAEESGLIMEIPAIVSYDEALSETGENELYGLVTVNGQDYSLNINNNVTDMGYRVINHRVKFRIEKQDGDGKYLAYSGKYLPFSNAKPDPENLPESLNGTKFMPGFVNMDTPPEEVMTEVTEIVNQIGLGEYDIQGGGYFASRIADDDVGSSEGYYNSRYFAGMRYGVLAGMGYGVHLYRVEDGIPIIFTYENGGQIPNEDAEKLAQAMEKGEDIALEVAYWPYEEMTFIYTDDGLRTFEWQNPYIIEDMSGEYVFLLPFSDISDIFEEMLLKKHADGFNNEGYTIDIQVEQVVLSYMRVRDKGSLEGTLIPVWDFFGTETYKKAGEVDFVIDRGYDGVFPQSLLTVNAMDGTIVDRAAGY